MIDGKKTEREKGMDNWLETNKPMWKICVRDMDYSGWNVDTWYDSERHILDQILHKVKLDIITILQTKNGDTISIKVFFQGNPDDEVAK